MALNPMLRISQYEHSKWSLSDGMFNGYPRSVTQTSDGYIWMATEFGLFRFDGVRFVPWQPPAETPLPGAMVVKLLGARDGSLWIGTSRGLARWKAGTLTRFDELAGQYVAALLEDRGGAVWAGTSAGLAGTAKLCVIRNGIVKCDEQGALGRFVTSLAEDASGTIWVGAATGLWRWAPAPDGRAVFLPRYPLFEIHSVIDGGNGSVLVAFNREIEQLTGGALKVYPVHADGSLLKPTSLLSDRHGGLWIGTQDRGLLHMRQGEIDRFTRAEGLSGDIVSDLFEDREGNVWAGTFNGLDRFRELAVATMSTNEGGSSDSVMSVLATRDGSVWLGTLNGLKRWKDGRSTSDDPRSGLTTQMVGSLFEDRRGRLWVSSVDRGLAVLENGRSVPIDTIGGGHIHAITEDTNEDLWAADQERGLFHIRGLKIVELVPWTTWSGRHARALAADPRGGIWLGFFQGGVAYFKSGQTRASYTAEALGGGEVSQLRFDRRAALWAATEHGLARLKDGRVDMLTSANNLPCDTVHWTMEDDIGRMWMDTGCGMVCVTRSELETWDRDPKHRLQMRVYDGADGFRAHSTSGSYGPNVARSLDGRLWFASYDGAAVIDPGRLPFNTLAPLVSVEQVTVDGTIRDISSSLHLPPNPRELRIDYTALSFVDPRKVRFRYKLENLEREWVDAGKRRQASYRDVPPGDYKFRISAANDDGVWNEDGAVLAFTVAPAIYQRGWFKAATVLLVAAVLWLSYRVRVRRLSSQLQTVFEARLAERTRMAQELHDTLLQGFLSTSMQLQVLAAEVSGSSVSAKLDRIVTRVTEVIEEGRQTMYGLRAQTSAAEDLERALARECENFRGEQAVDIRMIVEGTRQPLQPLIRDEIYRIAREALANAFRHGRATHVEIEVGYHRNQLHLKVRDDGCGIRPEIIQAGRPGHWGIFGMRERAGRIEATLNLWTRINGGTEVELVVPGHVVFARWKPHTAARLLGLR